MADSVTGKRITEFTELSSIGTGDFIAVDNASQDTKKYDATKLATKEYADNAVSDAIDNLTIPTAKIEDGAVTTAKIADANVTTAKIANSAVNESKIADSAVTSNKINNGAVVTAKIADGAVTEGKLGAGAVTSAKLGAYSVTNTKIDENAVRNEHITDGAVTRGKLASNAVTEEKIYEGAVTTDKLGASAVTTAKIADGAVSTAKIADSAVTEGKIGANAVTNAKIANNAVNANKIANSAVTTDKINNDAVTTAKINDSAVTTAKINDGAVTEGKLGSNAVTTAKINDGAVTESKIANSAVTKNKIADGAVTEDKLGEDVAEILDNKAEIDGYYEDLTAGSSEQLLSNTYIPDNTPYLFRTSGGSLEIGNRVYEDAIVGASVAWNQKLNANDFSSAAWITQNGATKNNVSVDNVLDISFGTSSTSQLVRDITLTNGHKFLSTVDIKLPNASDSLQLLGGAQTTIKSTSATTNWQTVATIWGNTTYSYWILRNVSGIAINNALVKNARVHDLTLMFGSTIADYAYTLEQSEAGSGIAWLKSQGFFTKDYYAYDAGSIQSVKTSAKKVVGFNLYDNATGKAHLLGGKEYQITGAYTALAYSTGETITPDANGKFTPSADGELTVTGGNATTTCVHLVWDGERDGEYEPYVEHTYPLDSDLELRGIAKLDSSNNLYYDGDTYASDGTVTRRYAEITFDGSSDEEITLQSINDSGIANFNMITLPNYVGGVNKCITNRFDAQSTPIASTTTEGRFVNSNGIFFIRIKSSTASTVEDFRTWLASNPITIVYELMTPTTESADPYTNPQIVSNWGTEEFVDERDVPVPVGHDSRYLPDLKAKLESAPNNPSTNGKYFLQYENGQATYVPVPSEVPQAPSEDGTYILKATVASGVATLVWVAEE